MLFKTWKRYKNYQPIQMAICKLNFTTTFDIKPKTYLSWSNSFHSWKLKSIFLWGEWLQNFYCNDEIVNDEAIRRFVFYGHFCVWGQIHSDDLKAVYGLTNKSKLRNLTSLIAGFKSKGLAVQMSNKRWRATTKLKDHYTGFPSSRQGAKRFNYAAVRERAYRIKELGFDAPLEQLLGD